MELRALRYFVAVAEERSFTRAADRLWIAQPGLSSQVRRLEAELGIQLFRRHARGVDLTPAGEKFLERARAVLEAVAEASATGQDLESGASGALSLGVDRAVRWRGSAELLEEFTCQRAGVELTCVEGYCGTLWRDLRDGRLDAMIGPSSSCSVDLAASDLGAEPWAVLVGRRHRLAGSHPLDPLELEGERIAVAAHRDGAAYDEAVAALLHECGVRAVPTRAALGPASQTAVAQGKMVAITTAPEALHADVMLRPLQHRRMIELQLIYRREPASPALAAFIRMAQDHAVRARRAVRPLVAA